MSLERPERSPRRRRRRPGGFRPPHCPNPACPFHTPREGWHYVLDGIYFRPSDRRRFQRFLCRHCDRHFSTRTFAADYWLRRRDLLPEAAFWASEGPGLRQTARRFQVSHTTLMRHLARLGRHCLLFHRRLLDRDPALLLREPLVVDGFESFAYAQFFPFHLNLAAGGQSTFLYGFTDSPLRRKGSMTPTQKKRRAALEERLGQPDPRAVELGFGALVREWRGRLPPGAELNLDTDDHPAYRRALRSILREAPSPPVRHRITSSKERRTKSNPLFPVNLADLRIRHGQANHRRETIAFSKLLQAAVERLAIFTVWSNCVKKKSENQDEATAAMELGLLKGRLTWKKILSRRLFPGHQRLSSRWQDYYWRRVPSPIYGSRQARHACGYAV